MNDQLEVFDFEIYTKDPISGVEGWDIKYIRAFGSDLNAAKKVLQSVPHFDCIITGTASYNGTTLNENERRHFESGKLWYYTDGKLVN